MRYTTVTNRKEIYLVQPVYCAGGSMPEGRCCSGSCAMIRGSEALKAMWSMVAPVSADVASQPVICLTFQDHRTSLVTKPFSFNGILRSDALTLENLRELTACRAQAYENADLSPDEKLKWQVCYGRAG